MNRAENLKRIISLAIVTLILIASIAAISSVIHDFSYFPSDIGEGTQHDQKVLKGTGECGGEGKGGGVCPTFSNKIPPEGGKPPHIPLFYAIGATNTHYLKAVVGVTYDGEMWELGEEPRYIYKGETLGHKVKKYQSKVKDEIEIKPIVKFPPGFIPISLYTDKVSLLDSLDCYPEQNIFYSSKSFSSPYSFTTTHYHFKESTLETSEAIDNEKYLQLPIQITDRTRQLAREITEGYETPYLKAKAIETYLRTNYKYDSNYTRAPEGWEPNDWFLFEEKRGVCANFNSAFVVLARAAGISSRVVSGYMIKSTSGTQTVFADQAHCWAEVGLDVGWITFDATGGERGEGGKEKLEKSKDKGEGAGQPEGEGEGAGACPTFSNKIPPESCNTSGLCISLFYVIGATNTCYLKAVVGVKYDGEMWELGEEPSYIYKGETVEHDVEKYQSKVKDEIEINPIEKFPPGFIPTSHYTDKVSLLDSLVYYPEQNIFYSQKAFSSPYSFTTTHYHFQKSTLETSKAIDNEKYLQLPTQITGRTRQLARDITKGYESPYRKAKAIENYLRTNYEYDLDYTMAPEGREPNDWFLFEEKKGRCANFNSAFVILARSAGIPSRVVAGYLIKNTSKNQTVLSKQRHCWAEIGLDVGWITFDATEGERGGEGKGEEKELTPTETEITSMSEVVVAKGRDFIVEGTVLTESGEKVNGVPVDVFLNENKEKGGMLCGQGETDEGYFEINCSVSPEVEVGDYHVIAHAIGNSKYGESWSDPPIKVISYTEINLWVPEIAKPGETVKIEGKLVEDAGNPISGEKIGVFVGDKEIARTTTNKTGVFSTEHAFPKKGNYTVKAVFKGTTYFLESNKEAYIVITLVSLDIETNNTFIRREDIDLCGRAQLGDSPLTNEPLNIQVGEQVVNITTDENGAFCHTYHVNQTQELGPLKLKYILPEFKTTKSQEVVVKVNTELNASVPDSVKPGDTINIGAVLRDDIGNPLEGELITLFIPGITSEITNQTNEKGETFFNISIPEDIKNAKKTANLQFAGSGFYLPSSLSHPLNINPGGSSLWFGLILLTLGLLSVVFFGIYKYKYKWRKTDKGEVEAKKSAEGVVKVERAEEDKIRIAFPQIKEIFPNVWGVGEELQISCAISDEETSSSRGKIEVQIDGTLAYASDLDGNGQCLFTWTFNEKGEYNINANFSDGFEFGKLSGTTRIRIVNYREEITKLYKSFLELLKKRNFAVHEETTPREVYEMLVTKLQDAGETADKFIGCFEIARYSIHAIERKDYERMVIAQNELEGKA